MSCLNRKLVTCQNTKVLLVDASGKFAVTIGILARQESFSTDFLKLLYYSLSTAFAPRSACYDLLVE